MRVKLKTSVSGPAGSWAPGIRDLPDELADEMLEAGYAELLPDSGQGKDDDQVDGQVDDDQAVENQQGATAGTDQAGADQVGADAEAQQASKDAVGAKKGFFKHGKHGR
jgi:hypothetical protein